MCIERDARSGGPSPGGQGQPTAEWYCRAVPADPQRLPAVRRALAGWAECVGMSAEQVDLVALTSYEALANAAAHAYPHGGGVLDVHAVYRPAPARVEIVVTDYGRWQELPLERGELGGRGLVLIDSLAEHAEIITTASGTSVRMSWTVHTTPEDIQTATD